MLNECLELLAPQTKDELLIDATCGEGGHSFSFLQRFPDLKIICIDSDSEILDIAKQRLARFGGRVHFYCGWSQDFFTEYPSRYKRPDKILIDCGISSYHYRKSGRGFSFSGDEELDMRLDQSAGVTAAQLIARLPKDELADLIYSNSGERYSRRIASAIVMERQTSPVTSAKALAGLVERVVPAKYRYGPIHPATRLFQALRIAVNGELSGLLNLLEAALRNTEPGGRLGVISFHSLEDKIIKNFFRNMNKNCTCPESALVCKCEGRRSVNILTRKGLTPGNEEIERNPPSRSARLRVVEKILEEEV
jgi:16S rRNA (cytosine1402-N4)-methyltransferase